MHKLRYYTRP